ncbi:hypothetical protein [Verrucosispora sp. WMMD573]|nr:hypothetical protein [Verrucosispora sp. WMMD573]WBB52331.1 hypothetical protein O7601_17160 [Verrucosispora sp. WMMD573]
MTRYVYDVIKGGLTMNPVGWVSFLAVRTPHPRAVRHVEHFR